MTTAGGGGGGGERDMKSEEVAPFTSSWTRVARPKLFLGREQCCSRNVRHNPSTAAAAAVAVASAVRPPSSLQMVTHFSASQSIPFVAASNKKRTTPSRT